MMRGIEDEESDALEALESIYLHTGRAYVVGVTGAPGVGKSTLLGSLIGAFRKESMKVGVVGLGGLGHMGVKFARAFGAHVVVFTTSPGKKEDALRLGAD